MKNVSSPSVPFWALWTGAVSLVLGALLVSGAWEQKTPELRMPLESAVPQTWRGYEAIDVEVSEAEAEVAGFTDYLLRSYEPSEPATAEVPWISTYVGYYDTQTRGRTIHSPKNCLPGSGWEALSSQRATIETENGPVEVNRYLLQRGEERALVLYWYQGRGRVVASEYRAKWDLLRDAALKRRSDEALVRVVMPIVSSEEEAFELARAVASDLKAAVGEALPL